MSTVSLVASSAVVGADSLVESSAQLAARRATATIRLVPHLATALIAPLVFSLAQRVHQATITVPGPGEVPAR